jgi:hypothetical protein
MLADTCFKRLINLSISSFAATPTSGLAGESCGQKSGLKIDSGEQLGDLVAVQRPAAPGAQIPQPDRSDRGPDEPLDGVIDRCEQATDDVIAPFVEDHLDHHPGARTTDHPKRIDLNDAVV